MKWFTVVILFTGAVAFKVPSPEDSSEHQLDQSDEAKEINIFTDPYDGSFYSNARLTSIGSVIPSPPVFALFAGKSFADRTYTFDKATEILKNKHFNAERPTVIYIHGFLEGLGAMSVKAVIDAYTERNDHNILVLDWSFQSNPPYTFHAVPNVFKVGRKAAQAVFEMVNAGLAVDKLYIVGHSLGGQMAGVIGHTVKELSNGAVVLRRIFALDPAHPGFYGKPDDEHLTADDADYVVVIHTDGGVYGSPIETGTVDFWPNGGYYPQPGCLTNVCSHAYSWRFWVESLNTKAVMHFNAVQAQSWKDFKSNEVENMDPQVVMGYYTPAGLKGNYYLRTRKGSPYALGTEGAVYKS